MKRLILFASLAVMFFAGLANAQSTPTRKVLLEEFTGSWCGWCPRGIWAIQQLETKYPNNFIPVAFHNSDPMDIPTGQDTLEASVSGYPDGWLDRNSFDGSTLNTDPANWDADVTAILAKTVSAGVTLSNVTFDPVTRIVSAKVNANFVADVSGDLRFNVYIIEDSVSGPSGSTYDQHNYLTGNATYADNPFYSLPATVPGYQHMHVVRAVLGGAYGVAGIIPASVKSGASYSATFSAFLPPTVNPAHASVVGYVLSYNGADVTSNDVLNADIAAVPVAGLTTYKGGAITGAATKSYITATRSGATTQTITLTNAGSAAVNVGVAIDNMQTTLPAGWTVNVSPSNISVPASGNAQVTLTFNAPANAGFATATVGFWPAVAGEISSGSEISVSALSANTKYVSYGAGGAITLTMPSTYLNDYVELPFNTAVVAAYPASQFDVGIFPDVVWLDYANISGPPPAAVPIMNTLLTANKKVFFTSTYGLYYSFDAGAPYKTYTNTAAVKKLINTTLGLKYLALSNQSDANGNPTQLDVSGFPNDPIGDGIFYSEYFYQYDNFQINSTATHTTPVLFLNDDSTAIGGIKYDNGSGQRLVYLNLNLGLSTDSASVATLVSRSMHWLLNGAASVAPTQTQNFSLEQNYPNPVAYGTTIGYTLNDRLPVSIVVHDMLGREVGNLVNTTQDAGSYTVKFDASKLAAGTYTYTLRAGEQSVTRTMSVTK